MAKNKLNKFLIFLSSFLIGIPFVSAYTPLDTFEQVFSGISTFFNFEMFTDPTMQVGFLRFILWILLFAVFFYAGNKVFKGDEGRKTAGIVAALISLIGVIFMPESAVLGIGTAYSAAIFTILVVGIAGAAVYYGMVKLRGEIWKDLMGLLILIFASLIMTAVATAMGAI